MSSSPMLPISVSTFKPNAESKAFISTPNFLTRISGPVCLTLSHCRPWTDLIDRTALAKPASFSDAISRIRKNFFYFRANYLAIMAAFYFYERGIIVDMGNRDGVGDCLCPCGAASSAAVTATAVPAIVSRV
ncbi:hypothetical protein F3Y22_tig00110287pilonHSYRG00062 [Hibiscus syriacus]|uniref:PRA1 family protein n=1 Tax=Hibiscus syriacus TaxID=106335 RepID=A0A6A3B449_HIBSY|nr:hypothetical protein F3Y22_tig00110287pilonHSYRG00062 [Hibiscus syriacus]